MFLRRVGVFVVRWREGDSIFFSIKGNVFILNVIVRFFLLIGLYFFRVEFLIFFMKFLVICKIFGIFIVLW